MTTHTQGPWHRGGKKELRLSVVEMEKLGVSLAFPQRRDAEADANSRRVVACLTACAGISTENLEDNLPVKELADRYNAVLKQRDMLLDVLDSIGHKHGCHKNAFGEECTCGIDAAIDSVKGCAV